MAFTADSASSASSLNTSISGIADGLGFGSYLWVRLVDGVDKTDRVGDLLLGIGDAIVDQFCCGFQFGAWRVRAGRILGRRGAISGE